jgi:nucleoside-diphosphate-sugar epimerase
MPQLRGSRALVTGAGGFVGANLVRMLAAEGAEVHGLLAPRTDAWRLDGADVELHRCDVEDAPELSSAVERIAPRLVFSLAVSRAADTVRLFTVNVTAVAVLVEAAHRCRARVVHLGSATEYGPSDEPLREADHTQPATVYGASKLAATIVCRALASSRGTDVVVLRPFMVYGPWDRPDRFVPRALAAANEDSELPLTPPGFRRDWVYVREVAEACIRAAAADGLAGEVLNVGTGLEAAPEEIAAMIGEVAGRPLRTAVGAEQPRAWDLKRWVADTTKLERSLGWRPRIGIREGLRLTHDWSLEHVGHGAKAR